jgi:large subunit ribosomal protein L16
MGRKKFKKYHKQNKILKNEKISLRIISKGFYGLKLLESGIITPKQIETARRLLNRITQRVGKIFINVSCDHPLTKKPLLSRMGKGVGIIQRWIAYLKKGKVVIETSGMPKKLAFIALKAARRVFSIKTCVIERELIDA